MTQPRACSSWVRLIHLGTVHAARLRAHASAPGTPGTLSEFWPSLPRHVSFQHCLCQLKGFPWAAIQPKSLSLLVADYHKFEFGAAHQSASWLWGSHVSNWTDGRIQGSCRKKVFSFPLFSPYSHQNAVGLHTVNWNTQLFPMFHRSFLIWQVTDKKHWKAQMLQKRFCM